MVCSDSIRLPVICRFLTGSIEIAGATHRATGFYAIIAGVIQAVVSAYYGERSGERFHRARASELERKSRLGQHVKIEARTRRGETSMTIGTKKTFNVGGVALDRPFKIRRLG